MKLNWSTVIFILLLLPSFSFSQDREVEIFGSITGRYQSKMYLFFEGNYAQKDSLSSEIKNGKFYFKVKSSLPVLARLHMDQESWIADFYVDGPRTHLNCRTNIRYINKSRDTLNELTISSVRGSGVDTLRRNFEEWLVKLMKSNKSKEEKNRIYYERLSAVINETPSNRVSPYLLSKAGLLSFSEVKELSERIDTSLAGSFEFKEVRHLLYQLEKSNRSDVGVAFHDFMLKDTNGMSVDSRQYRGKYTLIVCWASWCSPCRQENPELNEFYSKYKDKGLEMVGVSIDKDSQKWKEAILKDELLWTQVIDPESELIKYYEIEGIPATILINKDGKILGRDLTLKEIGWKIRQKL